MMHDRDERTLYARQRDRIAALEAELAAERASSRSQRVASASRRIAALEAELAAERERRKDAEKDAARYRWLRDKWFMPFSALPWCGPDGYTGDLDAAIDAARKERT